MGLARIDEAFYTQLANERRERQGPLDAQLAADTVPNWHIVTTLPSHEHIASGHLIGRRFGVYHPLYRETIVRRGRKADVVRQLFPGYLFVFVWGIDEHYRRIVACPGVTGLLLAAGRPAVVPDQVIREIEATEMWEDQGLAQAVANASYSEPVHKKRKWRRKPKTRHESPSLRNEVVTVRPRSMFDGIETLDDGARKDLLHRAIGLAL